MISTPELKLIKGGKAYRPEVRQAIPASDMRPELERRAISAVLGGMLIDDHLLADVLDVCPAKYFVTPDYAPLAEALDLLRKSGQKTDLTTLAIQMQERWSSDPTRWQKPDMLFIADMSFSIWRDRDSAMFLAGKLAAEARRAEIREGLLGLAADASYYGADLEEIADKTRKLLEKSFMPTESTTLKGVFAKVSRRMDDPDSMHKIPTPWDALNEILRGGFMPGELAVVAARPGLGKTALAINAAMEAARSGKEVLFISCEMSDENLACRIISRGARIDGRFFREGIEKASAVRNAVDAAMRKLEELPISIVEKSTVPMCPKEVRRIARGIKDLGMIVVDYLQLLNPDERTNSRERDVADMSRSFKQMALDLHVPVLLLSQLNRSSEEGREPRVSDLRESGAIEQDADVVILLHTDQDKRAESVAPEKAVVGKSRNTGTGTVFLRFDKAFSDFTEGEPSAKNGGKMGL